MNVSELSDEQLVSTAELLSEKIKACSRHRQEISADALVLTKNRDLVIAEQRLRKLQADNPGLEISHKG